MIGRMEDIILARRSPEVMIRRFMDGQTETPAIGLTGYVKWELVRAGKVIKDSGGFHKNTIVTSGMDRIVTNSLDNLDAFAGVGTGSAAPAVTDVALQTPLGTQVGRSSILGGAYVVGPPDYWNRQMQYKFLEANANGNLTEFGTFDNAAHLFSRQLLKDNTGTPITITKTNLDQLWITYELRAYIPTADVISTVTISGIVYDVTTRAMQANGSSAWGSFLAVGVANTVRVGTKESNVLLSRTAASDFPNQDTITDLGGTAYVAGNFYQEEQIKWDVGSANYPTGIGAIASFYGFNSGFGANYQMFQQVFPTTKLPKTNVKTLILFMRRHWARYP